MLPSIQIGCGDCVIFRLSILICLPQRHFYSLSESVSYWEQSSGFGSSSRALCGVNELLCGMVVEDGGATRLLGSLIVNGLNGNGVDPVEDGLSSHTLLVKGVFLLQSPSECTEDAEGGRSPEDCPGAGDFVFRLFGLDILGFPPLPIRAFLIMASNPMLLPELSCTDCGLQLIGPDPVIAGMLNISVPGCPMLYSGSFLLAVLSFLMISCFLDLTIAEVLSVSLLKNAGGCALFPGDFEPILFSPQLPGDALAV